MVASDEVRRSRESELRAAFGANVREQRRQLGLSQEQLAEACGLHRTYVGAIERGERNLSLLNIVRLADALSVTPADLLRDIAGKAR